MNSTSTIGAGPAPSGITPNFVNPDSIAYRLIIIAVVFPALSLALLSARIYTKRFLVRSVDLADCMFQYPLRKVATKLYLRLDYSRLCKLPLAIPTSCSIIG